jgi:hypothetical protein
MGNKKMTIDECRTACLGIWKELAETGDNIKPDTLFENDCPCCEYVETHYGRNDFGSLLCCFCPVEWVYGQRDVEMQHIYNCQGNGSVYKDWENGPHSWEDDVENEVEDRKVLAGKVLEFLENAEWVDFPNT